MPDLDLDLTDPREDEPRLAPAEPPSEWQEPKPRGSWAPAAAAVALLAVLFAVGGYILWSRGEESVTPAPPPAPSPAVAEAEEPLPPLGAPATATPALELPSLDASDELVRGLVAALSARPELGRWLVGEGLVRRLVAAVDNVAEGTHPRKHLPPLRPDGAFAVAGSGPAPVPATAAYGRYDGWVALFTSVEPAGTARLYAQLRPLIDEAYRDLGYPGKRFDDTLVRAFRNLLATPVPESPPLLTRKVTTWEYADPRLEALSPAQKQLLRLGPDNQRRVQGHLRALASALGIPQGRLPPAATYRR